MTILLVGVMLIRLTVTDAYQRYVRAGMGPWLVVAGTLLVVLGGTAVIAGLRRGPAPAGHLHDDENGHDHDGWIGWLLLVPVLALLLVAPPALGSFGVDRSQVTTKAGATEVFPALPAGPRPRDLTLLEFDQRSFDRQGTSMRGATVRLTGFVARPQDGDGFRLARYQIACCAADAVAAVARVVGASGAAPARDAWVTVTGTFRGAGADGTPEFVASALQQIPAPVDPYE
jgi:uncharacterized repeat protein (TIGR03943 family)